jgi:asparagine synthase (glutamine-hydrolysing)
MCGICGFLSSSERLSPTTGQLETMRDAMAHRGPDDAGLRCFDGGKVRVGLGHRRLSILDLSPAGHQPMGTPDGRLWVVFNGEVFNFRQLRAELERLHEVRFLSQTDTEVLLHGVRAWGLEGCLRRLRGMYAFALYDRADESLTLVRDPLGVKPLYYRRSGSGVLFASEIKALLTLPGVPREVDEESLYHYLTFASSPAPRTLFAGIRKLEAGCYLRVDGEGRSQHRRYWDPARVGPVPGASRDERPYAEELLRLLRQAVARRLVADVPVGVFLSGGVDSSLNVALMSEQMGRPVQTFSVGIRDDPGTEFPYAREVARRFGADHHEIEIDEDDFIDFLPRMAAVQDEPLADPVCVPLYYVSGLARAHGVPVIQVGEGSDELFAGYGMHQLFTGWRGRIYDAYRSQPRPLRRVLARAAPAGLRPEWRDALLRGADGAPFFLGNAIAFWDAEKRLLLRDYRPEQTSAQYIAGLIRDERAADPLRRVIQVELGNRLPELLLMRVDKMSMAHAIETRVPFLDEDLVEFALRLPSSLKLRRGLGKYLLKRAAEGILPRELIYRRKTGFCGSATNMLTPRLAAYARGVIDGCPFLAERMDRRFVAELFQRRQRQPRFNNFKVWNLLNLALWFHTWFRDQEEARAA